MIPVRHKEQIYSLAVEQHEDGYFGYFPALPGCHTWGATWVDDSVIGKNMSITHNLASIQSQVENNQVTGNLECSGNVPQPTGGQCP
jgi:hypothetical protein